MKTRLVGFTGMAVVLFASCASATPPDYLRPFTVNDGYLISVEPARAPDIVALNNTWIATRDFKSQATCNGKDTYIVVAKQTGIGQWLGGDLGCKVLKLSLANHEPEFVFNPFCKWNANLAEGNCLKAASQRNTKQAMLSRLRPATIPEIISVQIQKLGLGELDLVANEFPIPDDTDNWKVVTGTEPLVLWPLFNAEALTILVPENVKLKGGQIGHNQLYIGGTGMYSDPLCAVIATHGLDQLPIKLSGDQLRYAQQCE